MAPIRLANNPSAKTKQNKAMDNALKIRLALKQASNWP
jgi:hypothetical protein